MKKLLLVLLISLPLCGQNLLFEEIEDRSCLKVLSPNLAERKTAKIRLSNGLEALLISDPKINRSAAAIAIEAGSWDDPDQYPGMAHLLEHMLFMGTEAYPKEFEYMQYVLENGGMVNAYTASDRTVYIFSVNNEGFKGALDRFSHFFIDPLFLPSCIDRELLAVDQEHAKNIENDGWRQYMIFKETGNPSHPSAKFSTGNANTLGGIPQEAMKKWYRDHYSSHKMHLVLYSHLSIEEMIELATTHFSPVANNHSLPKTFPTQMTSDRQKGHLTAIKPVKDLSILSLAWEMPEDLAKDHDVHTGRLLSYILSSGSKNSLLGLLRKKHLARSIKVYEEPFSLENVLFQIDVELTDQGLKQTDLVIAHCFEALARIKKTGIGRYIFDEVEQIADIQYQYQSPPDSFQFVSKVAHQMIDEKIETFPRKNLKPTKYDPSTHFAYLKHLIPQNCLFFLIADPQITGIQPSHREKWMGAEYAISPMEKENLAAWSRDHTNPQIGLPPPNPFIPKSLELVHKTTLDTPSNGEPIPKQIEDSEGAKIFCLDDRLYLVPEVAHKFRLKSPLLDGSLRAQILIDLFVMALNDQFFPTQSAAKAAGSEITVHGQNDALFLSIRGFSDPSKKLVEELFSQITKTHSSQEEFELYRKKLDAIYANRSKELPLTQAFDVLGNILLSNFYLGKTKKEALDKITYQDFTDFANRLTKRCYTEGLLYGNLTEEDAKRLWVEIKKKLRASPYPPAEQFKRKILTLKGDQGPFKITHSTPMQGNAALLVIEEGNYSLKNWACQTLLGKVLKQRFFETLRTKQQTAYIAKAWEREEEEQLLQYFAVQSSTHNPQELLARFELFIEDFLKQFTTYITPERFESLRQTIVTSLEIPPENLARSSNELFALAFDKHGDFSLNEKEIKALQNLTYEDLRKHASLFLSRNNIRRIAVLMEGTSPGKREFRYETVSEEELRDQGTYLTKKPPFIDQKEMR